MSNSELKFSQSVHPRKIYAQYYTRESISDFLISNLPVSSPRKIVDLCMGEGALLKSAAKVYKNATLIGCDIDQKNALENKRLFNLISYHVDSSSPELEDIFQSKKFDLVLGNPPYNKLCNTDYIKSKLANFGFEYFYEYVPSALFFLVMGINLTENDGVVSYIIPDGLLTNDIYRGFRNILATQYEVISVIQLGAKKFSGTEAHTHIVSIRKKINDRDYRIEVKSYENLQNFIYIDKRQFTNRADYSYYNKAAAIKKLNLASAGAQLIRGSKTHKHLKSTTSPYIHTTSLNGKYTEFSNDEKVKCPRSAVSGDIIIARVGTRSLGRIGIVKSGSFEISDCIIIIRASDEIRTEVLNTLKSDFGQNWLKSVSKGVGARHITLSELKGLPVYHGFKDSY